MGIAAPLYGPGAEEPFSLRPLPDLAGTEVDDVNGRYAGTVFGTLADADSGLIRYLDLALADSDRHVLVPLGHAMINSMNGRAEIRLRAATREDLRRIPPYEPGRERPDGDYQRRLLRAHGRLFQGERYYAHPAYDHAGLYAGEHPIVREADAELASTALQRLSQLPEYQVAPGEIDIRGWPLRDRNGAPGGMITDLLVDPHAGKARYALVRRDDDSILIPVPVGFLRIDEGDGIVRTPALLRTDLDAIPAYHPADFSRTEEERILETIESRLDGERHFERADFFGG
jgi:hypothetical protein